ncbi:MAG: ABC-2 family transporter protein [Pelatocladus maniniholoensis HA4357-MV3]|jgi:ABC-2 type transport system permease protein|uniref:ABC-2 family transporter protein n=1 Tax=Pelatocladus maniniholoensis HA4357-MV3 TaxID=1117104 RepID=A0A9E3H6V6_9NOST|nr:ABC-2 family transporter protein [Pelatocladus maniniholoensis HA4357-MV3]
MQRLIKTILTFLSVYYAYMVEYRAELILWVLAGSLPIILMGVWIQAAQGGQFGLTSVDFARYFLAVFLVRQFTVVWVIWEVEREVVEGKLSNRLLQPIDPVWHHVAAHVSERVARIPFAIVLVGLFFLLYPQAFWIPSLGTFLLFSLVVILAFILRFAIQYTFAIFSFWTERASALEDFWFLFFLFLSGMIAPLEVFPESVRTVVLFTPFPYLINFPASILVGIPVNLTQGLVSMLGWILLFFGLNRWLWRQGLKRYSGMGA